MEQLEGSPFVVPKPREMINLADVIGIKEYSISATVQLSHQAVEVSLQDAREIQTKVQGITEEDRAKWDANPDSGDISRLQLTDRWTFIVHQRDGNTRVYHCDQVTQLLDRVLTIDATDRFWNVAPF